MANGTRSGDWRAAALAAALAFVPLTLGGCAGGPPSQEESQAQDKDSRYAQAMRMAASVRAGGDHTTAAMFYQRAHLLFPNRADPLVGLAEVASAVGAREEAFGYYRQAVALDPGNVSLRRGYGSLLLSMGLPDPALEMFAAAVAKDPQDFRSYNGKGIALDLLGRQPEAQEAYGRGLAIAPANASLRNNLALSIAIAGDHGRAIALLQQQASEGEPSPRLRQNLALVHALDGQLQDAVAIAGRDLTQNELRNNIALYQTLPGLTKRELAAVAFGFAGGVAGGVAGTQARADVAQVVPPSAPAATASLDEAHPAVQHGDRPGARGVAAVVTGAAVTGGAAGTDASAPPPRRKRQPTAVVLDAGAAAGTAASAATTTPLPTGPVVPLVAVHAADLGGAAADDAAIDAGLATSEGGAAPPVVLQPRPAVHYARSRAMAGPDLSLLDGDVTEPPARGRADEAASPSLAANAPGRERTARPVVARERGAQAARGAQGGGGEARSRTPAPSAARAEPPAPAAVAPAPVAAAAPAIDPPAPAATELTKAPSEAQQPAGGQSGRGGAALGGLGLRLIEPSPSTATPAATSAAAPPPSPGIGAVPPPPSAGAVLPAAARAQDATPPLGTADVRGKGRPVAGDGGEALLFAEPPTQ